MPDLFSLGVTVDPSGAVQGNAQAAQAFEKTAAAAEKTAASADKVSSRFDAQTSATARAASATDGFTASQQRIIETYRTVDAAQQREFATLTGMSRAMLDAAAATQSATTATSAVAAAHDRAATSANMHGLGLGRIRMELATFLGRVTDTVPMVDRLGSAMASMAVGSGPVIAITAGLAAIAFMYEKITATSHAAAKAADEFSKTDAARGAASATFEAVFGPQAGRTKSTYGFDIAPTEKIKTDNTAVAGLLAQLKGIDFDGGLGDPILKVRNDLVAGKLTVEQFTAALKELRGEQYLQAPLYQRAIEQLDIVGAKWLQGTKQVQQLNAALRETPASIQAAVQARSNYADQIAQIIASGHASGTERQMAQGFLANDRQTIAATAGHTDERSLEQRNAAIDEMQKLDQALNPPNHALDAATTRLDALRQEIDRIVQSSQEMGKEASIDAWASRTNQALSAVLDKAPQLSAAVAELRTHVADAAEAQKEAAYDKVAEQIREQYNAQAQLNQAMIDGKGSYHELTAAAQAQMEINREQLALGRDLNDFEQGEIRDRYALAAATKDAQQTTTIQQEASALQEENAALLNGSSARRDYAVDLRAMHETQAALLIQDPALRTARLQAIDEWHTAAVAHNEVTEGMKLQEAATKKLGEAMAQQNKQEEELLRQPFLTAIRDIQRDFSTILVDLFTPGKNAAQAFWNDFKNIALKTFADIASAHFMESVLGAATKNGLASAFAGVLGVSLPGRVLHPPAGLPIDPSTGLPDVFAIPGFMDGSPSSLGRLGKGLGGVAAGMLGGQLAGGAIGRSGGSPFAGALGGAAMGAAIGMPFGPIGIGVGAVVGALAGFTSALSAAKHAADEMSDAQKTYDTRLQGFIANTTGSDLDKALASIQQQYAQIQGAAFGTVHVADANAAKGMMAYDPKTGIYDVSGFIQAAGVNDAGKGLQQLLAQAFQAYEDAVAKAVADAAQQAAEKRQTLGLAGADLIARQLSAGGQSKAASDFAFSTQQTRETLDATKQFGGQEGFAAYMDQLQKTQQMERDQRAQQFQQEQKDFGTEAQARLLTAEGHTREADALRLQMQQEQELRDAQAKGYDAATLAALTLAQAAEKAAAEAAAAEAAFQKGYQGLQQDQGVFGTDATTSFQQETDYFGFSGKSRADVVGMYVKHTPGTDLTPEQQALDDHIQQWLQDYDKLHPAVTNAAAALNAAATTTAEQQFSERAVTGISYTQADTINTYLQSANVWLSEISFNTRSLAGGAGSGGYTAPTVGGIAAGTIVNVQVVLGPDATLGDIGDAVMRSLDGKLARGASARRAAIGQPRTVS